MRPHDFDQFLAVLRREPTDRPVLFEFIGAPEVMLPPGQVEDGTSPEVLARNWVRSFAENGYDFASLAPWALGWTGFPKQAHERAESISQNEGGLISDRASFEAYPWPDLAAQDWSQIQKVEPLLAPGMKFVGMSMGGVLENLTDLVSYETLCYLMMDDEPLVQAVADAIGSRLLAYYEKLAGLDCVGAAVVNDDWGFKTQTLIAPDQLRQFIFPWHKRIVQTLHDAGKPAILHSCGQMEKIWDDIIDDLRFDGKHSYEDAILPVEEAYAQYGGRIAIMGGIDIDFLCRSTPDQIRKRARAMLARSKDRGGYALGSGNSITRYLPRENFLALRDCALEGY